MRSPGRRLPARGRAALAALVAVGLLRPAAAAETGDDRITDEIVIELAPAASAQTVAETYDLTLLESVPEWRFWRARVAPGAIVDDVVHAMRQDPLVREAEPHRAVETPEGVQETIADLDFAGTPSDFANQSSASQIQAPLANARYAGRGVRVAILDTSVALDHPEIASVIYDSGADFAGGNGTAALQADQLDNDGDGLVDESLNHGTHVAGLIHLVAPQARLIPVRVLEEDGRGTTFGVANGILWATRQGVDVINLSLSLPVRSRVIERAIEDASDAGIVVVAAVGNRGLPVVEYPASEQDVIAVAAIDPTGARLAFSNYGPEVDVSAPGLDLLSTYGPGSWARWSGTSFATPLVSGAVALLIERYPGLTPLAVRNLLAQTAAADANPPEMAGLMGAGVLDADALTRALTADRTSLRLDRVPDGLRLRWSPVLGASSYDVVRGRLSQLQLGYGSILLGELACEGDDVADTELVGPSTAPGSTLPGDVDFYLFRDDAGAGDYGTDADGHPRLGGPGDCPAGP